MAADKIQVKVTMANIYSYEAPAYGYGTETRYIYTMRTDDEKVYVWKTTAYMGMDVEDENGSFTKRGKTYSFLKINKGDVIEITATIKGEGEYKGQPQTELMRVKVKARLFKAETWEEVKARREAEKTQKAQTPLKDATLSGQCRISSTKNITAIARRLSAPITSI